MSAEIKRLKTSFWRLRQDIQKLESLLMEFRKGDCWCGMGIGHPLVSKHSETCLYLQDRFRT